MGPRGGLDMCGKYRLHRDSISRPMFQEGEDLHRDLSGRDAVRHGRWLLVFRVNIGSPSSGHRCRRFSN